jgi:alpha-galactosidase
MGWNPWYRFGCSVTESLARQTADAMVSTGMAAAGYKYLNLDDCWMALQRDATGTLQADAERFPSGIAALASYAHASGLALGLYLDAGSATCMQMPGSGGHYGQDAATVAAWGVDYIKLDFCNTGLPPPQPLYADMHLALLDVGRPIILSVCEWGIGAPWQWAPGIASLWRTAGDYGRYGAPANWWRAVLKVVDLNAGLARYAHPGAWNDPDILLLGTGVLTPEQERSQLSLWSMMAAPLLVGGDIRSLQPSTLAVLLNREVIAVDQDPAGRQGVRIARRGTHQVWSRELADGSRALLLFNEGGRPAPLVADARRIGLPRAPRYLVRDLYAHRSWLTRGPIRLPVAGGDAVMLRVRSARAPR